MQSDLVFHDTKSLSRVGRHSLGGLLYFWPFTLCCKDSFTWGPFFIPIFTAICQKGFTMKKFVSLIVTLSLLLCMSVAYAAEPVALSLSAVDYQEHSLPVNKTYVDNERFALAVSIDLPPFYDTANLALKLEYQGVELDDGYQLALAEGVYILAGTVTNAKSAAVRVTIQDQALEAAVTAEELYAAMQNDRTVSATFSFAAKKATVAADHDDFVDIPKTGDASALGMAAIALAGSAACIKRRK